jgi:hypothetical protein
MYNIIILIHFHCDVYFMLPNSMEYIPSREAGSHIPGQEIPRVLCNRKIHYVLLDILSLNSTLSQTNPFQTHKLFL